METPTITSQKITAPTKFSDEEISKIEKIKELFANNTFAFGQLFLERKELDAVEAELIAARAKIESEEKSMMADIVKKYGEGSLDPKTYVFTPKA